MGALAGAGIEKIVVEKMVIERISGSGAASSDFFIALTSRRISYHKRGPKLLPGLLTPEGIEKLLFS
jgi:hypothetical protein